MDRLECRQARWARRLVRGAHGERLAAEIEAEFRDRREVCGWLRRRWALFALWTELSPRLFYFAAERLLAARSRRAPRKRGFKDMWNDLIQDVRYALRSVRGHVGFFVTAVLIIGLGTGGATAIFSVVNPMLLRPLPFAEPERLVWIANEGEGGMSVVTSRTGNLRDFRRLSESFERLSGFNAFFDYDAFNLTGAGEPERVIGVPVADDLLDVLGVQPLLGRSFREGEGIDDDATEVVVLAHGFWQRRFSGDASIVGQTITLNGQPATIVGVTPASFDFATYFAPGARVDFLWPFPINDLSDQNGNTMIMIGRLSEGRTIAAAQAELDLIIEQLQEADPNRWGLGAVVTGLQEQITGRFRRAMLLLAGAAGLVMMIVCANLSNLLLARATTRRREIAVRRAMGASRARLIRQLLTESLVLSGAGALLGTLFAYVITRVVANASAIQVPLLHGVAIDAAALTFTLVMALLAGLSFGIVPALQISTGRERGALGDTSRGSSASKGGAWTREALVVSEVALACVLLVGGGLLLRSFFRVLEVDLGFESAGTMAWRVDTMREFDNNAAKVLFYQGLVAEIESIPGVESVGLSDTLPLGRNRQWGVRVPGEDYGERGNPNAFPRLIDTGYLETMRIPLVAGRRFAPADTADTEPIMIINETMARDLFPAVDPIGQVVLSADGERRVAGVVGDVRHSSLEERAGYEMYFPIAQLPWFSAIELVVRSELPPASLAAAVRNVLRNADPDLPAGEFQSLGQLVERSVSPRRFILVLIEAFAATALLLASLGIYGVLSYSVSQRARELGIRMALGASAGRLRRRVVARTLTLAGAGIVVGWIAALALRGLIGSLLYGVEPADPLTFAAVGLLLVAIAALAGYIPARRASRIDPMAVLSS